MITIVNGAYRLGVHPEGERVLVAVGDGTGGTAIVLTREQAEALRVGLGEMLDE